MKKRLLFSIVALCVALTSIPFPTVSAMENQVQINAEEAIVDEAAVDEAVVEESNTAEEDIPAEWALDSSASAPEGAEAVLEVPTYNAVDPADTLYPEKKALLIQDNLPWSSRANYETLEKIVPYDVTKASEMVEKDISGYNMIVFANDQAFSTYKNYALFRDKLENYVTEGGILVLGACDSGWANGELVEDLPGGVTKSEDMDYHNYIVDATHPIVTRVFSEGVSLQNADLYNNYCSHIAFNEESLPEDTNIILENDEGEPTLIEYRMGKGTVIASGLTWEHNYVYGGSNGRGTYAKKAFDDLFLYALSLGEGMQLITPYISYTVDADKVGIFVGDKADRDGLIGATVIVNGVSAVTDKYGVAQIALNDGSYEVAVSFNGYYSRTKTLDLKKGSISAIYMTENDGTLKPYIEEAILNNGENVDIIQQRLYFTKGEETEVTYNFSAELAGKSFSHFLLYQGEKIMKLTSATGTLKPATEFEAEKPIYLQLVCADGTKSNAYKTGIFIKDASSGFIGYDKEASTAFHLGRGVGVTIPGTIPIIGGTKFNYGIDSLPVTIEISGNKVKIAVGITDFKSGEKAWEEFVEKVDKACETADRLSSLEEMCKAYGAKAGGFTVKRGWDAPEFSVAGYIEGIWDGEGITAVSGKIMGGVDWKYSYNQQFIVGPVPVYFEIGGGFKLELSAQVKGVLRETGEIQINVPITFTPYFTIGGGAGINGALSVGAEGEVGLPVEWDIANEHIKVSAEGSMKLKASLLFVFTAEKEIAKGTWVICDQSYANVGEVGIIGEVDEEIPTFNANDYDEYSLLNTSYRDNTGEWNGEDALVLNKAALDYETILQDYVLPGTKPQVASANGTTVMVFQADNGAADVTESVSLMYSVMTEDGWTTPELVWENNGEADYYAELVATDTDIYLVWQKAVEETDAVDLITVSGNDVADADATEKVEGTENTEPIATEEAADREEATVSGNDAEEEIKTLNSEESEEIITDNFPEDSDIVSLAKDMEIAFASFDGENNAFAGQTYVTDNAFYDGSAVLAKNPDGTVSVVWVENESGDILTPGTTSKIMHSVVDGANVSTPETLVTTTEYIFSLDAAYVDGTLNVAYSADVDGDLNSENDVECYLYKDGAAMALTDDEVANLNPQIMDGVLYWYEDNTIVGYQLSDGSKRIIGEGSANYQLVKTANGTEILFVRSAEESKDYFYTYVIQDSAENNQVCYVAEIQGKIDSFSAFVDATGCYNLVCGVTDAEDSDNFKLAYLRAEKTADLNLRNVVTSDQDYTSGSQKATLVVKNEGLAAAEGFTVEIYEDGYKVDSVQVSDSIASCEEKTIDITFDRDTVDEILDYKFVVVNSAEKNNANNTQTVKLGYNDISVKVTEYYIDNNVEVFAEIANLTGRTSDVQVTVYENSVDGEVVFSRTLEDLSGASSQIISFSLNRGMMNVTPGEDKLYVITVTTVDEVATGNNQHLLLLPTLKSEVTSVEIENGATTRVFDYDTFKGQNVALSATVYPANVQTTLAWASSNSSVASVNEQGVLTINGVGKTTVTVSTDGFVQSSIEIQVVQIDKTAPTGVTTASDDDGVVITWTGLSAVKNYEVYRSESKADGYTLLGRTASCKYTDRSAERGKTYYYKVRGYLNNNGSYIYTQFSGVVSGMMSVKAPSYVSAYKTNYNTMRVYSGYVSGADGYEIYRATSKNGSYTLISDSTSTTTYDSGLAIGTTYYYKARAYIKVNGVKYYSAYSDITSAELTLDTPYFNEVSSAGDKQIFLKWEAVDGASGYEIYRCNTGYGTYKKIATVTKTEYLNKSLKKNTTYYYKIKAYYKKGSKKIYSGLSYYYSATTGSLLPYNAKASYNGKNNVITFGKPAGAKGVEISWYNSAKGTYKVLATTTKTSYTHKKVTTGTSYSYRLRSYKVVKGKKVYSDYKFVSCYTNVGQVENFKVTKGTGNSMNLTWTPISWAKGYEVYRQDGYSGSFKKVATIKKGATKKYTDKNLKAGTTYVYRIRAYTVKSGYNNYGSYSEYAYGSIVPEEFKLNLAAKAVDPTKVKLTWKKMSGAAGYEIYRSTSKKSGYKLIKTITKGTTASYTDSKLTTGKTYYYRIRPYKTVGAEKKYEEYSSVVSIQAAPAAVTISKVTAGSKQAKITWKKTAGASGYEVYRSTSKSGKYTKVATIKKGGTVSYTDKKLTSKKTYYYKVRAYKTVKGKKVYGEYSAVKSCKVK